MPVFQKNAATRAVQETLVVVIEECVASAFEEAAVAMPADVRSVQMTGYFGSQRSTGGEGACQGERVGGVEVGPSPGDQKPATVADVVAVAPRAEVASDGMEKVEVMIGKLRTENLALHVEIVAERAAHARALIDNFRLQRDREKTVKKRKRRRGCRLRRGSSGKIER